MQAAFGDARASVTVLGDTVNTVATDYNTYATQVAESSDVMAQNMDVQKANLEAAHEQLRRLIGASSCRPRSSSTRREPASMLRPRVPTSCCGQPAKPTLADPSTVEVSPGTSTPSSTSRELRWAPWPGVCGSWANECRKRAQECREAKAALDAYRAAQVAFAVDSRQHGLDAAAAAADPTLPDPGPAPTAPTPPPAPPPYVTI